MKNIKNIAIILAGGKGERLGLGKPKQFLKFAGKMCLEHVIDIFYYHKKIDLIIIVINAKWQEIPKNIIKSYKDKKIVLVEGGDTRNYSTYNALEYLSKNIDSIESKDDINLIIHDAARPLVSKQIIDNCLEALQTHKAIDTAIPAIDTIIEAKNNIIDSIPKRDNLYYGQTPQCFKYKILKDAYKKAKKDNPKIDTFSDDCGLLLMYSPNVPIFIVSGESINHKLTKLEDIPLIDRFFQLRTTSIQSYDYRLLSGKVIVVFGGTSGIGEEIINIANKYNAKTYALSRRTNCDISKLKNIESALKNIAKIEGKIDIVINMSGILYKNHLINTPQFIINELINVNYKGALNIAKASYRYLHKSKGMLMFASSSSYSRGREEYSIYSSLKAAIVNLTQALSDEWRDVAVNCIVPERTLTPMRIKNFGKENPNTLLSAKYVASKCLDLALSNQTGIILCVSKNIINENANTHGGGG